jgi:hypothetical protein
MSKDENKYSQWVFTVSPTRLAESGMLDRTSLTKTLNAATKTWVFQKEKATNEHYQGILVTHYRVRKSTLLNHLVEMYFSTTINNWAEVKPRYTGEMDAVRAEFTIAPMVGTWDSALAYCTKEETRVDGPWYSDQSLVPYSGSDVNFLQEKERRYPWQHRLIQELLDSTETTFKDPDDRTVIWIYDPKGCSGKSKLVKYLCINYPGVIKMGFGTSTQLRAAVASIGPRQCYFIDVPRTRGYDDSIPSLISVIEDLKGGFVTSSMYGKHTTLTMAPPHIVIFSNQRPNMNHLSDDRWDIRYIYNYDFHGGDYGITPAFPDE